MAPVRKEKIKDKKEKIKEPQMRRYLLYFYEVCDFESVPGMFREHVPRTQQ